MIIRCVQCHMPFPLNREQARFALDEVHREGFNRYNAQCPRCGRANAVGKNQLKLWVPDWEPPKAGSQRAAAPVATPAPSIAQVSKPAKAKPATKPAPAKPAAQPIAPKQAAAKPAKEEPSTRKKLSSFDLNARTLSALEEGGVSTVAAMLKKLEEGQDAVTEIKGVGPAAYDEIRAVLKKAGYKLPK